MTDSWDGVIKYDKINYKTLTWRNLLLRGSILRSTEFAIGIVIYVGKETKINLNTRKTQRKISWLLSSMHAAIATLLLLFLVVNILVTAAGVYYKNNVDYSYLKIHGVEGEADGERHVSPKDVIIDCFQIFIQNIVLFSHAIPMSIYVAIEAFKFIQVKLIHKDTALNKKSIETMLDEDVKDPFNKVRV